MNQKLTKATVVIPTYNNPGRLRITLTSLCYQDIPLEQFEVIVVDHGSEEDIEKVVASFSKSLRIKWHRIERQRYGAGSPRNSGILIAEHDLIIMLDADMIVCPQFVRAHQSCHNNIKVGVAVGYIFGLGWTSHPRKWMGSEGLNNFAAFAKFFADLAEQSELLDWREPQWVRVGDDLMKLPAPWGHFWTGNTSVKRSALSSGELFDEVYCRAEDVDLGYRLHRTGVQFGLARSAAAFHIPHAVNLERYEDFQRRDYNRFLTKFPLIEVEAYVSATDQLDPNVIYPDILEFRDSLALTDYPPRPFENFSLAIIGHPCLIIGCGKGDILRHINAEVATESNQSLCEIARRDYRNVELYNLLGLALPFPDKHFECTLITDFWQFVPPYLLRKIIKTALRISRRVLLLKYSDQGTYKMKRISNTISSLQDQFAGDFQFINSNASEDKSVGIEPEAWEIYTNVPA